MKEYTLEEFQDLCNKKRCCRNTMITNNCKKDYKQQQCFEKFFKQKTKEGKQDNRYDDLIFNSWVLYSGSYNGDPFKKDWQEYCMLWKCLNEDEKEHINKNFKADLYLNCNIDVAHIEPKGSNKELQYSVDNVVLLGRYFHNLLDTLKDPVYKTDITKEQRLDWFFRMQNYFYKGKK